MLYAPIKVGRGGQQGGQRGSELTIDTPNASTSLSFRNQSFEDSSNLPDPDIIALQLIRNLPLTHPLGLTLSLPLNRPSGFPIYIAASQGAPFPSMSTAPAISIVEDLEAALQQS